MSSERPSIQILPGDMAITMQLVWLEPPNNIIIKRWPLSEWTPDDSDASHSLGVDFVSSWMTHWKKTTNISFSDPKAQEFTMDPIEWIDSSNADRIKALNLNQDDDFPSGFYINNPTKEVTPMTVDRKEF